MPSTAAANRLAVRIAHSASRRFPDTVTFKRSTVTKGSAGGNLAPASANTTPASVPCRYRPAGAGERELAGKAISGTAYMIFVPAQYSSALIDVDSKCQAVIAARSGSPAEPARTLNVQTVERYEGVEIAILATLEE